MTNATKNGFELRLEMRVNSAFRVLECDTCGMVYITVGGNEKDNDTVRMLHYNASSRMVQSVG